MKQSIILSTLTTSLAYGLKYLPDVQVACEDSNCPEKCTDLKKISSLESINSHLEECVDRMPMYMNPSAGLRVPVIGQGEVCGDRVVLPLDTLISKPAHIKAGAPLTLREIAPLSDHCSSFVVAAATGATCQSAYTTDAVPATYAPSSGTFALASDLNLLGSNQIVLIGNLDCSWSGAAGPVSTEIFFPFVPAGISRLRATALNGNDPTSSPAADSTAPTSTAPPTPASGPASSTTVAPASGASSTTVSPTGTGAPGSTTPGSTIPGSTIPGSTTPAAADGASTLVPVGLAASVGMLLLISH